MLEVAALPNTNSLCLENTRQYCWRNRNIPVDVENIKRTHFSNGNTINYPTTILEGLPRVSSTEELFDLENEVAENLFTAVVEHPLADAVGRYRYSNNWVDDVGKLRLKSDFGFLDVIISQGINDNTGQVPEFEKLRNLEDQRTLEMLTNLRQNNSSNTVVKFSPSPPNINDPEVRSRGYQGNDQISFFDLDGEGQERITTEWLPFIEPTEYISLFERLIEIDKLEIAQNLISKDFDQNSEFVISRQSRIDTMRMTLDELPESAESVDISIMQFSRDYSPTQILLIQQFIDNNKTVTPKNEYKILGFCEQFVRTQIQNELLPQTYKIATMIQEENFHLDIDSELVHLFDLISESQFSLRLFIRDELGINTFNEVFPIETDWQSFQNATEKERSNMVKTSNYQAAGCGFSGAMEMYASSRSLFGKTSALTSGGAEMLKDELYKFECPGCGYEHPINVPLGIYVEQCFCGFDASC